MNINMGKTNEFFWNNNLEWLNHWYGISASDEMYCGEDFVESNGRVFFKARLSSLIGSNKEGLDGLDDVCVDENLKKADANDWAVGFVKSMSLKATIIEVLKADMHDKGYPTLSVHTGGISWIDGHDNDDGCCRIRVACASSKYLDDYRVTYRETVINDSSVSGMKPTMILIDKTEENRIMEGYVFFADCKDNDKKRKMYSVKNDSLRFITDVDTLYGYNEKVIYLGSEGRLYSVIRKSGEAEDLNDVLEGLMRTGIYEESSSSYSIRDSLAYIDSGRNELFFYEKQGAKYPGECALIGLTMQKREDGYHVLKDRIECPEVLPNGNNPVIFDGSRYIWRIKDLWSGYKIFRRDGSLRNKFLVSEEDETSGSSVVFSTPSCIFMEWGIKGEPYDVRLSYTTNKGLCRMFAVNPDEKCLKVIPPEDEDRIERSLFN